MFRLPNPSVEEAKQTTNPRTPHSHLPTFNPEYTYIQLMYVPYVAIQPKSQSSTTHKITDGALKEFFGPGVYVEVAIKKLGRRVTCTCYLITNCEDDTYGQRLKRQL